MSEGNQVATPEGTGEGVGTSGDVLLGGDEAGGNPGGVASAAAESAATSVTESYAEFELPEGVSFDAAELEERKAHYKELGLTQEQAQKLITRDATKMKSSSDSQVAAVTQLRESWVNAAKADSEIGGDGFDQSIASARLAVSKYGTPQLNEFLRISGIGNNPEVIRVFARIGKDLKEDQPTPGGGGTAPEKKDRVSRLYPPSAN